MILLWLFGISRRPAAEWMGPMAIRTFPVCAMAWILLAAFLVTGCGGRTPEPRTQPKPGHYPYTEADVQFMSGMIGHHAQALVMAGWAPSHGASPAVRTLAERIVSGQKDEIALMQQWLRNRGQRVPEPSEASSMEMHGETEMDHSASSEHGNAGHQMLMPGMLTRAQMDELNQARGRDYDRLFLTYMIQHHRGAVTMVNQLFGTTGAAREEATFKLANDVSADQSSEIARMERMLGALPTAQGAP